MRRWHLGLLLLVVLEFSLPAAADGRFSTYLEGTLVRKTSDEWVLATEDYTYWIDVQRTPSWSRRHPDGRVSFWIQLKQIRKMRPNIIPLIDTPPDTAIAQK